MITKCRECNKNENILQNNYNHICRTSKLNEEPKSTYCSIPLIVIKCLITIMNAGDELFVCKLWTVECLKQHQMGFKSMQLFFLYIFGREIFSEIVINLFPHIGLTFKQQHNHPCIPNN
jgi:hypothetical protein